MGSWLGEVLCLVSRRLWKWKPCCLAVLSHHAWLRSLTWGALGLGTGQSYTGNQGARVCAYKCISKYYSILKSWTLFTELWFTHSVFQSIWTNTLWSHLLYPLQMNVSLCPLLQTKKHGLALQGTAKQDKRVRQVGFFESSSYYVQQGN